jgi:hypothetical protein
MSFRCKGSDGIIRDVTWQRRKNAWVAVITICIAQLYKRNHFHYLNPWMVLL